MSHLKLRRTISLGNIRTTIFVDDLLKAALGVERRAQVTTLGAMNNLEVHLGYLSDEELTLLCRLFTLHNRPALVDRFRRELVHRKAYILTHEGPSHEQ